MYSFFDTLSFSDLDFLLKRKTLDSTISSSEPIIMHDRAVLITGAGGSIGTELSKQILRCEPKVLILFDLSELAIFNVYAKLKELLKVNVKKTAIIPVIGSVQNEELLIQIMRDYAIEVVYHAAAYKHVSLLEVNIVEAVLNNVFGTYAVVRASLETNVTSFVLVSTDKAVMPASVMGATKRFSELIVQAFAHSFSYPEKKVVLCIVRFGNVLGSSGSVFSIFLEKILAGKPLTITHPDVERYFMTPLEAAHLVIQAELMTENGGIFFFDMGEPIKISDLAKRIISLDCFKKLSRNNVEIQYTGLKQGEKLRESLFYGKKVSTNNSYIFRSLEDNHVELNDLMSLLTKLSRACDCFDMRKIIDIFEKSNIHFGRRI